MNYFPTCLSVALLSIPKVTLDGVNSFVISAFVPNILLVNSGITYAFIDTTNLRELGLTPEDPSREAYWVANGNRRRAGRR